MSWNVGRVTTRTKVALLLLIILTASMLLGVAVAYGELPSHPLRLVLAFGVLTGGLLLLVLWPTPQWAVVAVVFLLPFPQSWPNAKIVYVGLIVGVLAMLVLRGMIAIESSFERNVVLVFTTYLMLNGLALPVLLLPLESGSKIEELVRHFSNLSLFLAVASVTRNGLWRRRTVGALFLTAVVAAIVGVMGIGESQLFQSAVASGLEPTLQGRAFSLLGHPNLNGQFATLASLLFIGIWTQIPSGRHRNWLGAGVLLILCNLLMSGSRAAMLGLCVGLAFLWVLADRRGRLRLSVAAAVAAVGLAILLVALAGGPRETIAERVTSLGNVEAFYTALAIRPILWRESWSLFLSSPLWGVGQNNLSYFYYQSSVPQLVWLGADYVRFLQAHNVYLQFLASAGAIGLLTFLALMASYLRRGLLERKALPLGLRRGVILGTTAALVSILAMGAFETVLGRPWSTWQLFFILLGLFVGCVQDYGAAVRNRRAHSSQQVLCARQGATCDLHCAND